MKVIGKILESALEISEGLHVEDYVVGLGLVGVRLSNGSVGLAYNLRSDMLGECEEFFVDGKPPLEKGMEAKIFIEHAKSSNPIEKSLGMATVNAILNDRDDLSNEEILEVLEIKEDDVVGMIGKIKPFAFEILQSAKELRIFERNRSKEDTFPDWAITSMLEDCSVVIISASSVVNWTIEWILDYVKTDRVAIVGPSAPLTEILPVMVVGGAKVVDPEKAFEVLKMGGGTKSLYSSGAAVKVALIKRGKEA